MNEPARYLAVLGGNELACPALQRLKDAGHALLVVDGNAESPGRHLADVFLHVNFSDRAATEAALAPYALSGIMPINDFGVRTAAHIAQLRHLPGNSDATAIAVTNKAVMRQRWAEAGLPQPRFLVLSKQALLAGATGDWNEFPCIIKPAYSGGGSRGVTLIHDWAQAQQWVGQLLHQFLDDEVLLEQYLPATEHTIEVLVWPEGKRLLSISDKENYPGNVAVVQNLYFPGPIGHRHRATIEPLLFAACDALGMTAGTAHFEVLIQGQDVYLLEVGGRPGGGINLHPICQLSTGNDYPKLYAAVLTGQTPVFDGQPECHLAWHYFNTGQGALQAIEGAEQIAQDPDVVDFKIYEKVGAPLMDKSNDLARPGYVLVRAASHEAARAKAMALGQQIRFITQPTTAQGRSTDDHGD